jgi:hypothetical protein
MARCYHYSDRLIEDDFQDTIEMLHRIGNSDPFYTDEFGDTAFHRFLGPTSAFDWLRQNEQIELASLSPKETYEPIAYRVLY